MKYNIEEIKRLIKPECEKCDLKQRHNTNTKCKDCNFRYYKKDFITSNKFCNINFGNTIKSHLYYFLYHPELNFEFPDLPEEDSLGNKRFGYKKWIWEIHHDDHNHSNDSKENLILLLRTEHESLHQKRLLKKGMHNFQNEEVRKKNAKTKSKLYKKGNHPFQMYDHIRVQNLSRGENHYRRIAQQKLVQYIRDKNEDFILTTELANDLGYNSIRTLRDAFNVVIKRYSMPFKLVITKKDPNRRNSKVLEQKIIRLK